MLIDCLTILFIVAGMAIGMRRGAWFSMMHMITTLVSLFIAAQLYRPLADRLILFLPFPKTIAYDMTYYLPFNHVVERFQAIVAFVLIALIAKGILYMLLMTADRLVHLKQMGLWSRGIGLCLGSISAVMMLSITYYMLSLYPSVQIQWLLSRSFFADKLILDIPWLSTFITQRY